MYIHVCITHMPGATNDDIGSLGTVVLGSCNLPNVGGRN